MVIGFEFAQQLLRKKKSSCATCLNIRLFPIRELPNRLQPNIIVLRYFIEKGIKNGI